MAEIYELYKKGCNNEDEALVLALGIAGAGIQYEEAQKRYDNWSEHYEKDMEYLDYWGPKLVANEMASYLRDNKKARVLDCAAGTGLVAKYLSQHGFTNIDAYDINPVMLEEAKKKGLYVNTIVGKLGPEKMDIPDDTYDGLMLTGAFYEGHVKPDCLPQFARIVKPGGFIVLGVRELNLVEVPHMQHYEWLTQQMEKCGQWRQLMRKVMPDFYKGDSGLICCFTPLPKVI